MRRFWIAVFWTLIAALEAGIAWAIWSGVMGSVSGGGAKLAVMVALGALLLGGIMWAFAEWWRIVKLQRSEDIPALRAIVDKGGKSRTKGAVGGALFGVGGLAGIPVAALGLMIGTFAALGWVFVIALMSYGRYFTIEEYLAAYQLKHTRA